ncbi:hypothetical protein LZ198_04915 [Myxococcus sp. K15C18031901]|uniref:hypothetical protein n=1 Tax=Myxococcus dinghuensis TaxID=2906761 RepID=UPI0020A70032|nr:hypothetical protein [Myxococcus dinghuensis]MCP3098218.1 hypothetical protein [Myxococcus dinghuensis]
MPVAQTGVTWLDGGAAALWEPECVVALIACGINPANFGTYDKRARAQAAERKAYRKKRNLAANGGGPNPRPHEANCEVGKKDKALCMCIESDAALKELGVEKWMLANSQSGHISQNALYQNDRGDPCSNVPAEGQHGGTYGYRDNKAFCMDHLGRANNPGTIHYEITNREAQHAQSLKSGNVEVVTEDVILEGVKGTAAVAAQGAESRQKGNDAHAQYDKNLGTLTPERKDEAQRNDQAKEQHAAALTAKQNGSEQAGPSGTGQAGTPNAPSTKKPTPAEVNDAVKCISDAWKQSLDQMRNDTINEFSTAARSDECKAEIAAYRKTLPPEERKKKIRYTDLPADRRAKVDAAVKDKVDTAQDALKKEGAKDAMKANNPPTQEDCLKYQANWLQQHQKADGTFPPMQGRVPDSKEGDGSRIRDDGRTAD